ncbi:hypothetical protein Tco_1311496 [Tanacetum coccineum]
MGKLTAEAFKLKKDLWVVHRAAKEKAEKLVKARPELNAMTIELKDLKDTLATRESELLGLRDEVAADEKTITEFRIGITSFFRISFEMMVRRFLQSDEFNRL